MTPQQIIGLCAGAERFAEALAGGAAAHDISTPTRQAMFLAQLAHESGGFIYTCELWGPTPQQKRYSLRADLGNTRAEAADRARAAGDEPGHFYAGHGLIQISGYDNHLDYSEWRYGDDRCARDPMMLARSPDAAWSAVWFWITRGCNELADPGDAAAFERVTRRINGGLTGLASRQAWWAKAKAALA